jgi:hypothetical protein
MISSLLYDLTSILNFMAKNFTPKAGNNREKLCEEPNLGHGHDESPVSGIILMLRKWFVTANLTNWLPKIFLLLGNILHFPKMHVVLIENCIALIDLNYLQSKSTF